MTNTPRRCATCAATVNELRVLCPRCGVDLDEPTAPIVWPEHLAPVTTATKRPVNVRQRLSMLVAGLLLIAIGIAVAVSVTAVSDDDVPELPTAQRETAEEIIIEIAEIGTVSSTERTSAPSDPQALLDDDTDTIWFGDVPTLGFVTREQIVLRLAEPAWIARLVIANGVHASLAEYDSHGRARTVELMFDGGQTQVATLLDIERISQQIQLKEPMLTTSLRITVLGVYPGQTRRDVALTALELRGYTPTAAQKLLAEQRANELAAVAPDAHG